MAETKQRKEKFQGLLSYFENFASHFSSTPKKAKVPKTPKSDSKLAKNSKNSKISKPSRPSPKSESKKSSKKSKSKAFNNSPVRIQSLQDKENIPNNTTTNTSNTFHVLKEKKQQEKEVVEVKKEVQFQQLKEKEKEKEHKEKEHKQQKEKENYDSDSSYAHTTQRKKRRQSFSSVRTPKKNNRRMTLGACEISPVLLKHSNIQTRPLSWNRGSATPTPVQIKRSLCAGEILQTEENFVSRLELLKKTYIQPLQAEKILTNEEIISIFSNVEIILNVNRALLSDLKDLMHDWEDSKIVGDIFVKVIPFLKIYTDYVNNHQSALAAIDHFTAKNAEFKTFIELAPKDEACNGLLLRDFLIDPVQRIPRYELLLKELLKNTPEEHPDHIPLETALEEVRRVANILNEKNREQKSRIRMLEIQKIIGAEITDLIQPHRILIEETDVLQVPSRAPATVLLFNDILIFSLLYHYFFLSVFFDEQLNMLILVEFSSDKKTAKLIAHNPLETVWIVHSKTVHESKDASSFGYTYGSDCLDPEIGELVAKELVFEILWPGNKFVFLCKAEDECEKIALVIETSIADLIAKQPRTSVSRSNYRLYRDGGGIWEVTAPPVATRITREQYEAEAVDYTQRAIQELLNANALAIRSLSERKRKRKTGLSSVIQRLTPKKSKNAYESTPSSPTPSSPSHSASSSPYRPSITATPTSITNTPMSSKKVSKLNTSSPQVSRPKLAISTPSLSSSSSSIPSTPSTPLLSSSSSSSSITKKGIESHPNGPGSPRPSRKRPSLAMDEVPNEPSSSSSSSSSTSSSVPSFPALSPAPKVRRRSLNSTPGQSTSRPVRRTSLPSSTTTTSKTNNGSMKRRRSAPSHAALSESLPPASPRPSRRRQSNGGDQVKHTPKPLASILSSPQTPRSSMHTPSRSKTPKKVLFAATP